ncbi:MAG TPA: di-trans,poly-cis-decaprenylcistransferase [Methylococcaceae bacterium]|jgi:undecaprenyl diphosphate synthase|nr:di-trans,poly-cis-decaprenylcistransferase [Methylococcaceae bacterium]HIN68682.1 di-trans,poly-cis-decaprenylcistransferase [Methylococcales bacterium]HIA45614.1 di-trans,poly-cis-decaprenylcistransferase [Methylococcaceae bacterium]HIB62672.1 di-trans,poly-cis-decaprenylcistransferase [Methylococcaceae bacterium]HIO13492.1 di-trans,poly-cis-decaprenylcistransferase [Methylococcales bacterium]
MNTVANIKGEAIGVKTPKHIAIVMDGNGRWAQAKHLPRTAGHHAGSKAVRRTVEYCVQQGVEILSLFAFSSENWRRPKEEIDILMRLFMTMLKQEVKRLNENRIRLLFIGDRSAFSQALQDKISESEQLTCGNTGMTLVIAANYGGRWDICQAAEKMIQQAVANNDRNFKVTEQLFEGYLETAGMGDPDLFIRTGGEKRISNFMLWQMAYTEFFNSAVLWPDFNEDYLREAIFDYQNRQRRFGHTGEQVESAHNNNKNKL